MPINIKIGGQAGPTTVEFEPNGHFLSPRNKTGSLLKPDRTPAFTRVGAVLTVEEELKLGNPPWIDHRILFAHNPHAVVGIPDDLWGNIPQLLEVAGEMRWNDGAKPY
jgi:hypothetical protein